MTRRYVSRWEGDSIDWEALAPPVVRSPARPIRDPQAEARAERLRVLSAALPALGMVGGAALGSAVGPGAGTLAGAELGGRLGTGAGQALSGASSYAADAQTRALEEQDMSAREIEDEQQLRQRERTARRAALMALLR